MAESRKRKKKKRTKSQKKLNIISPIQDINIQLLSKIGFSVWPKEIFNTIEGREQSKNYYNSAFAFIQQEISNLLNKYHPASWARVSYLQLELWSILWLKVQGVNVGIKIDGRENFIAFARYGWKYILEVSLEAATQITLDSEERPSDDDIRDMFTLLNALSMCSETSNYIHFFSAKTESAHVVLSQTTLAEFVSLNSTEKLYAEEIIRSIGEHPDYRGNPELFPDNYPALMEMVKKLLSDYFGFTFEELEYFTSVVLISIISAIKASIIVDSFDHIVELSAQLCGYPTQTIVNMLNFLLLDVKSADYIPRNFLTKSQQKRMINYCGAVIYLNRNLGTIYSPEAKNFEYIRSAEKHILIAPLLIEEWKNNFLVRLVYGQREDLKLISKTVNNAISEIEAFYHLTVFEESVRNKLKSNGFLCVNLDRIDNKPIECGEIDVIAYSQETSELLIVEAKSYAPSKDSKAMGQIISDHFKQKKYHQKFTRKIKWVEANIPIIEKIFLDTHKINIRHSSLIHPFFITNGNSIIQFLVTEYNVMSYSQFSKHLDEKNAS